MVSKSLLQELKTIIKEEYNEDWSDEQVYAIGTGLVRYFDLQAKLFHRMFGNIKPKNENTSE